ncbi:related to Vacuolar protein sorting-associated protein 9 [Zygosaccharomyces bailii]|nr:related to Vacuolar protein sorting-associated protein 9 [Zygosaccharomyces bailii]
MSLSKEVLNEFDPLAKTAPAAAEQAASGGMNTNNAEVEKLSEEEEEEPFYDFQLFTKELRDPNAEPIVRYIKSFLHNFQTVRVLWTADEQAKLVKDFKIFIYDKYNHHKPFSELEESRLRNAQEGLEKLIMGKLYGRCFSPCLETLGNDLDDGHKQDLADDCNLRSKSREYRFISPEELDIPNVLSEKLNKLVGLSGRELNKMNHFKAPRDKMICVLNSCKVIMAMLTKNKLENGADSFIPLLIYTILKGNLSSLASNIRYIERFRFESFLRGEALYYLNSLQAAVSFIIRLEQAAFTINNNEHFKQRYESNQLELAKEAREANSAVQTKHDSLRQSKTPHPSEYLLQPLDGAANTIAGKFNHLFSSKQSDNQSGASSPSTAALYDDDNQDIDRLAQELQDREQRTTLEMLKSMFPEMDPEIVEDVCIAKRYRIGITVDILLSL